MRHHKANLMADVVDNIRLQLKIKRTENEKVSIFLIPTTVPSVISLKQKNRTKETNAQCIICTHFKSKRSCLPY